MAKKFFPKDPPNASEQVKLFDEAQGRLSELGICLLKLAPVDSTMYDLVKQLALMGMELKYKGEEAAKVAQQQKDENTKRLAQEENNVNLSVGGLLKVDA